MKTQRMIFAGLITIALLLAQRRQCAAGRAEHPDPQPAQIDHTGALALTWKRSTMWTGDFGGPSDSVGRHWQHPQFDDSTWTINLDSQQRD